MFKQTSNLSEMSSERSIWAEISGKAAVQVMHRGHEPKVVVSQEYFFRLLAAARIVFPEDFEETKIASRDAMLDEARSFRQKLRAKDKADTKG